MKYCPQCQKEYPDDAVFCQIDGRSLVSPEATVGGTLGPPRGTDVLVSAPLTGVTIDNKVRLETLLGRGGMGAVYQARHLLLDRIVAVKVLRPELVVNRLAADRFLREARASARIEHPNVITVYDFGVIEDNSAYLVTEFIQGRTLRDLLKEQGRIPPGTAFRIIREICAGVEAAHRKGVIHRDLKPENIMLKESDAGDWSVKVLDFGLAKVVESEDSLANLTNTGDILGTPAYMSPEHCTGDEFDIRTDVYSLGVLCYELFVGYPPFRGKVVNVLSGHLSKTPTPAHVENPDLPEAIGAVIQTALEKERENRPQSVQVFFDALEEAFAESRRGATRQSLDPLPAPPAVAPAPLPDESYYQTIADTHIVPADERPTPDPAPSSGELRTNEPLPPATSIVPPSPVVAAPHRAPRRGVWLAAGAVIGLLAGGGWWATHRTPPAAPTPPIQPSVQVPVQTPVPATPPPSDTTVNESPATKPAETPNAKPMPSKPTEQRRSSPPPEETSARKEEKKGNPVGRIFKKIFGIGGDKKNQTDKKKRDDR